MSTRFRIPIDRAERLLVTCTLQFYSFFASFEWTKKRMTSNALHSVVFQIPTKKHSYMLKVENDENCTLNREHRTIYIKHKTCNSSSSSYLLRKKLQLRYNSELFRLYTEAKLWFEKPITYHRDCTFHGFFTSPTPPTAAFCENEYSRVETLPVFGAISHASSTCILV